MTRPQRGDELELQVDTLAYGGAGVARTEGYVVFVRGGLPGDRVRARVTKSKRSFAEADSVELLMPSPTGCSRRRSTRARPGRCSPTSDSSQRRRCRCATPSSASAASPTPRSSRSAAAEEREGYRNKLEYSFGDDEGRLVLGFHRPGASTPSTT